MAGRLFTITGIGAFSPNSSKAVLIQFNDRVAAWIDCSMVRFSSLSVARRAIVSPLFAVSS